MKSKTNQNNSHHKNKYWSLWICGIIVIICLFLVVMLNNDTIPTDEDLRYCEADLDCTMVNTCGCDCPVTAINKQYIEYWDTHFECGINRCIDSMCTEHFSVDCVDNQCILTQPIMFRRVAIEAQKGVEETMPFGIKNTDNKAKCFRVEFKCVKPRDKGNACDTESGKVEEVIVGGYNYEVSNPWFETVDELNIDSDDAELNPISYLVTDIEAGTYLMKLNVYKGDTTCDKATEFTLHQSKNFFFNVRNKN